MCRSLVARVKPRPRVRLTTPERLPVSRTFLKSLSRRIQGWGLFNQGGHCLQIREESDGRTQGLTGEQGVLSSQEVTVTSPMEGVTAAAGWRCGRSEGFAVRWLWDLILVV